VPVNELPEICKVGGNGGAVVVAGDVDTASKDP
jgi:hypothetical protein